MRSLFEPCGSWQVEQLSVTGGCSQRCGPRFSPWQETHDSLTVPPSFSSFTFLAPCTLWQEEHESLPSRTGMWLNLYCLFAIVRWHWAHRPVSVAALSCLSPAGAWMLWQEVQPTLRSSC